MQASPIKKETPKVPYFILSLTFDSIIVYKKNIKIEPIYNIKMVGCRHLAFIVELFSNFTILYNLNISSSCSKIPKVSKTKQIKPIILSYVYALKFLASFSFIVSYEMYLPL